MIEKTAFYPIDEPKEIKTYIGNNYGAWVYETDQKQAGLRVGVVSGPPPEYGGTKPTVENTRKGTIVDVYMENSRYYYTIKFDDGYYKEIHPAHNVFLMENFVDRLHLNIWE